MYGIIASEEFSKQIHEAVEQNEIWYEQIGEFSEDSFVQSCQAAANANVQTLIIDMSCTDDGSIIRGIQQFRLLRDSRIVILAPGRVPGDSTITTLLGLQVLDIVAPEIAEEEGEDPSAEFISAQIKHQLSLKPSYGNVVRWDVKTAEMAKIKKALKLKEKPKNEKPSPTFDPGLMEHIEQLQIHPPPVRERTTLVETIIGTILIAVIGAEETAGTTHTSLLITNYLARKGYRVAVIEANEKSDFAMIESAYQDGMNGYSSRETMFSIEGIDHYKSNHQVEIARLLEMDYDYIILDLGSYLKTPYLEEFYRAHVQIISGHGIEWRQSRLFEFSKTHEHRDQSKWIYTIPHSEKSIIHDIEKGLLGGRVFLIPWHPDPYQTQKDTDMVLDSFLKEYIGKKRRKSRISILYSIIAVAFIIIIILTVLLISR